VYNVDQKDTMPQSDMSRCF